MSRGSRSERVFTVEGTIGGRTAAVSMDRGALKGDPEAIATILKLIEDEAVVIEAVPAQIPAALSPAWVAQATVLRVFDEGARLRGRRADPPWFRDPPGTVY